MWKSLFEGKVNPADLLFLSRHYETVELPREKQFLFKYFDTEVQIAFLKYLHVFGNYDNFSDHTGYYCTTPWLKALYERCVKLEVVRREAKNNFDLEFLTIIEAGGYKFNDALASTTSGFPSGDRSCGDTGDHESPIYSTPYDPREPVSDPTLVD